MNEPNPVHRAQAGASTHPGDEDTLAAAIRRRLAVVVAFVIAGLVAGGVYLLLVPKQYVAVSTLFVRPLVPQLAPGNASGATASVAQSQVDVVRSTEVLRLADRNGELGQLPTLSRITDPVPAVKRALEVEAEPRGDLLRVAYASRSPEDAVKVVDLIVSAYQTYQSEQSQRNAEEVGKGIQAARQKIDAQLAQAREALARFDAQWAGTAGAEATPQRAAVLLEAATRAQLDTFAARRAYDEAVADAGPALAGLDDKQLEGVLQTAAAGAPESPEMIAQEVQGLTQQLAELRKTYAENHPSVIRATQRLKQIRLTQVASTRLRWQASLAREASVSKTLDQVQKDVAGQTARNAERSRLAGEVSRFQTQLDEMDRQLSQVLLTTQAGGLRITVDTPAEVDHPGYPPLPRVGPTLATTGLVGLVLGGLFALLSEYRSAGSLRHVVAVRSAPIATSSEAGQTLGLKVLGTVPQADPEEASTPAAISWSAQLDPFGPIANAVRTMRGAMEIEGKLPATILLTAAADQQGTTTLAVNLAMTIARENRKVLLIDMNFRSPMVASILEVDGARGLTELLVASGDPVELIRTTTVPRLDVLPAGSMPQDPGAMLNSDAFAELVSMLTNAYDHVIFDAPSLAHGDDARIVASMCDGTVLVARPSQASLRRAAGARDLLLTIGANLLGVALTRGTMSAAGMPSAASATSASANAA